MYYRAYGTLLTRCARTAVRVAAQFLLEDAFDVLLERVGGARLHTEGKVLVLSAHR